MLAKMVCLACLVVAVAFVAAASAAVGNQKNLAAHSTLDSRMGRQQAGRQAGGLADAASVSADANGHRFIIPLEYCKTSSVAPCGSQEIEYK